jgi:cytochrome c-type biogenesis protein CcmE
MSRIDDELEQAVRDVESSEASALSSQASALEEGAASHDSAKAGANAAGAGEVTQPVVSDAEEPKRGWGLLVGLMALMGGILVLVFNGSEDAVVYSYKVNELKAKAAELGDRQVRVQGSLVYGSLAKKERPCEHRFQMTQTGEKAGGEPLTVLFPQCVVPDQFREVKGVDVEVTAEGRLESDGSLVASKIFAKCPSKYEMKETAEATGVRPQHNGNAPGAAVTTEMAGPRAEGIR